MKEEYVIYYFVAMVSAVGGTMGLCIGFSFVAVSNCLLNYIELGIHFISKLKQNQVPFLIYSLSKKSTDVVTMYDDEEMILFLNI